MQYQRLMVIEKKFSLWEQLEKLTGRSVSFALLNECSLAEWTLIHWTNAHSLPPGLRGCWCWVPC